MLYPFLVIAIRIRSRYFLRSEITPVMSLKIIPVVNAGDLELFIDLPRRLYEGDPRYQPPLTLDRRHLLDPAQASFFSHGEAQYWLAIKNGKACGRISAQIDHATPGEAFRGMFGCLDAIEDLAVVEALLNEAENWLKSRDISLILGPCLLSVNSEAGLLVEGQSEPAMILTPWHPEYLGHMIEACGYKKAKDLFHLRLDISPEALSKAAAGMRISLRRGSHISVRTLSQLRVGRDVELLRTIYNDAWQNNWGFVPLMKEDVADFKGQLRPFLKSEYGIFAEIDGRIAGMALVLPNIAEMSADLGVRPSLFGLIKLLWRGMTKQFTSARIILMGISRTYANSMQGMAVAMTLLDELLKLARRSKLKSVEGGWVLEDNRAVLAIYDKFHAEKVRTLRIFEKRLRIETN